MSNRFEYRRDYIEGWETLDADLLVASVTEDFVFDDPAMPELITRVTLADYMVSWSERVTSLGGTGEFELSDVVNHDQDGVLTCWEWWKCVGTPLEGAAIVKTTDDGVQLERIVYHHRR